MPFLTNKNFAYQGVQISPPTVTPSSRVARVTVRGHVDMTSSKFSGFWTPSLPLSVPNSRNLPSFCQNLANPLPPPQCRRHLYIAPKTKHTNHLTQVHGNRGTIYSIIYFHSASIAKISSCDKDYNNKPFHFLPKFKVPNVLN